MYSNPVAALWAKIGYLNDNMNSADKSRNAVLLPMTASRHTIQNITFTLFFCFNGLVIPTTVLQGVYNI